MSKHKVDASTFEAVANIAHKRKAISDLQAEVEAETAAMREQHEEDYIKIICQKMKDYTLSYDKRKIKIDIEVAEARKTLDKLMREQTKCNQERKLLAVYRCQMEKTHDYACLYCDNCHGTHDVALKSRTLFSERFPTLNGLVRQWQCMPNIDSEDDS